MFANVDSIQGRNVLRAVGLVSVIVALAAGHAAYSTLQEAGGAESVVEFVLFAGGAALAATTAVHCFSRRRTLEEFVYNLEEEGPVRTARVASRDRPRPRGTATP